ncbi:YheC/YheD family protein [Heyndrickxia acidiproducens]|uniref:YheC/YheD family endospore coat-associated protein n=1 Tax=Heyndrickxia acidiproducens TaxID=1121084 RepID=UPI0003705F61|nr:YheC/YheD family protein [Heyndrickxia acidiproducens]
MATRYKIEFFEEQELILYTPSALSFPETATKAAFGSKVAAAKIEPHPNGRNVFAASSGLAAALFIPDFLTAVHCFQKGPLLLIGPLVGIFSSGFTPYRSHPIGARSALFAKLLSVQAAAGVAPFLFGEQHIDWEQGLIRGFFYSKEGWESRDVPFPNAIYDRLPNRRSEAMKNSRAVKEKLEKEYLIPWYNPGFFNKLEVHDRLFQDHRASLYLPETHALESFHQIERMLSDYGQVYVKPIHGSLGLGVHQIVYSRRSQAYYCRYHDEKNRLLKFRSLEALMNQVFAKKQPGRLLVQQGIHLIADNGRPVDFRVHANKDENGDWHVTAIAAKVAGPGSPTTHLKNGGEIKTLEQLVGDSAQREAYRTALTKAALTLAQSIDDHIEGIIGEIGFDLGIDTGGKVWLFEANSKPGRSIFTHPFMKEFDWLTRKMSLSFAVYVTARQLEELGEMHT